MKNQNLARGFFHGTRPLFFALLMLSLLAGGCVRTANPILKDDQVVSNDVLLGKWVSRDGKVSAELRPPVDGRTYRLTYTNEQGKAGNFLLRFGKLDELTVAEITADALPANVGDEFKGLLQPLYMMLVIQNTDPLTMVAPNPDWMKKYIQAHPGELLTSGSGDDMIIQSPTEDFQAFILKHRNDQGLFGDPAVFVHPGDPTTQRTQ